MIWDNVKLGDVIQDVYRQLWLVTDKEVRMDDLAHPFLVVRIHCLSDPEHAGSKVYAQSGKAMEDTHWSEWSDG